MMYRVIKRILDFLSSVVLFVAISPIFIIIMVLVLINMGRPIFFTQERSSKNMKTFKMIKFRTMREMRDCNGDYLPDEKRKTRFGNWLRSTSLDELPELINIIKGDMSVIGPRPLPTKYNDFYYSNEVVRFNVRSGLITPDSIDDTPLVSWDKQFEYESEYAKRISFKKDLVIFFSVFKMLFKRKRNRYGEYNRKPLNEERKNG